MTIGRRMTTIRLAFKRLSLLRQTFLANNDIILVAVASLPFTVMFRLTYQLIFFVRSAASWTKANALPLRRLVGETVFPVSVSECST